LAVSGGPAAPADAHRSVIWHQVECGAYAADLALWRQLAAEAAGPVLELGCGAGRVTLDLARAGHEVAGLDHRGELLAEQDRLTAEAGVTVQSFEADARSFELGRAFSLVLAPMQLVHLIGGPDRRADMLVCVRRHLEPGGTFACALLEPGPIDAGGGAPPVPDVRELDGWVYSSQPVEVRDAGAAIEVRRLRQAVSPQGELSEDLDVTRLERLEPDELVREAARAGLIERERIEISPTADHVGSIALVFEADGTDGD
jgi:SAM-dependent methyltransferase